MNADIQFDFFLFYLVLDPTIYNSTSYIQGDYSRIKWLSLEICLQICPKIYFYGDSKSHKVDNQD